MYDVGGEIVEELISNVGERGVDSIINGKEFGTLKELLEEGKETAVDTAFTTLVLSMIGLGGESYQNANYIHDTNQSINELIDKADLTDQQKETLRRSFSDKNVETVGEFRKRCKRYANRYNKTYHRKQK